MSDSSQPAGTETGPSAGTETGPSAGSDAEVDTVDGALVAVEVASAVTAIVAFALHLDGSTTVAIPGGSLSALATGFWILGSAAVAAATKARYRGDGTRSIGHAVLAVGFFVLAAAGGVTLVSVGGLGVTGGTVGVLTLVAGGNLVVLDVVR